MRQRKKVIQTQTEGKEESGYNEGRKAKKCDGDIGNNEVHHPNWMSCHVLVGNWAGGWLKLSERRCQLFLTHGCFVDRRAD